MENYFNYFTEIEEHFQNCRGTFKLLSPLDWSLIESFQAAGIPLEVVLKGIERVFEKHNKKKNRTRMVNSLAYCTQTILAEFERHKENLVGSVPRRPQASPVGQPGESDRQNLLGLLDKARERLAQALGKLPVLPEAPVREVVDHCSRSLEEIKTSLTVPGPIDYQTLETKLCIMEEKILGSLISGLSDELLLEARGEVQQEIHRHRRTLKAEQIALLERKMLQKKLFDRFGLPRLSLFYLPLN